MKISHSSAQKYSQCPRKWKFHYIDRLRGEKIPSPLFFGSALDEAFSRLLLERKINLTEEELDLQLNYTAEELFQQKMLKIQHNGAEVELAQSPFADYYSSDFTPELLEKRHLPQLNQLEPAFKLVDFIDFHQQCKEIFRAKKKLPSDDQILYNYLSWTSLCEKGLLMVDAYRNQILPEIHEVFDIQKSVSIKNADGDEITGLIDFTASFKDSPSVKYCVDNKSSSEPYKADSVEQSEQLATYCEAENINTGAYAVVQKKVFKKGDKIRTQLIKSEIPESTFEKTFDNFEKVVYNVESEYFPCNWDNCFAFGRVCEYYKLCKYGKMDGIVKLPEKK